MIKRYRFCAPPGHSFELGPKTYVGGDEFELEESQAADDRLVLVDDYAEAVDIWPMDDAKEKATKAKKTKEHEATLGRSEPESAPKPDSDDRSPLYPKED